MSIVRRGATTHIRRVRLSLQNTGPRGAPGTQYETAARRHSRVLAPSEMSADITDWRGPLGKQLASSCETPYACASGDLSEARAEERSLGIASPESPERSRASVSSRHGRHSLGEEAGAISPDSSYSQQVSSIPSSCPPMISVAGTYVPPITKLKGQTKPSSLTIPRPLPYPLVTGGPHGSGGTGRPCRGCRDGRLVWTNAQAETCGIPVPCPAAHSGDDRQGIAQDDEEAEAAGGEDAPPAARDPRI